MGFAAMLFEDESILMLDGTTDGGCRTVDPVPEDDDMAACPTESRAEKDCLLEETQIQPLPAETIGYVCGGLTLFICLLGMSSYCCLRRIKNEDWILDKKKGKSC